MRVYSIGEHEKERIKRLIKEFLIGRKEILFAYLHGSFLSGPFRDIDIAVYTDGERDVFYELELEGELEERLGFPVDVRVLNNAPISFRFKVLKGNCSSARMKKRGVSLNQGLWASIMTLNTISTLTGGRSLEYDEDKVMRYRRIP